MRYDFDTPIDRRGSGSLKWDVADGELPMWVADMDFKTAPEVVDAILKRARHGVFGYSIVPDEWYSAIGRWWSERHGFDIEREWTVFCTGVVPAISSVVRKLTTPAEKVLIQTPVYNIFFNSIVNNGRYVSEAPLSYENGEYRIDFELLEDKMADPQTTMMILCNPHNPVGKIWDRETLERIGDLAVKHHVVVISDEIHCDITAPGKAYIPFASVSENCRKNSVTCIASTKAFNIAGMQSAAVVVPDPALRARVERALNTDEVAEPNAFAITAAVAAFDHGGAWLDALREYVFENRAISERFFAEELPEIKLVSADASYLLWLDCSSVTDDTDVLVKFIRENSGLYLSSGAQYGEAGRKFIRMNVACPRSYLLDGLGRLKKSVTEFACGK